MMQKNVASMSDLSLHMWLLAKNKTLHELAVKILKKKKSYRFTQ